MPKFELLHSRENWTEKEWKIWVSQFRKDPCLLCQLLPIFRASDLLHLPERDLMIPGKKWWIFDFDGELFVYPKEVYAELAKRLRRKL